MDERRKHRRIPEVIRSEVHDDSGMTFSKTVDVSQGGLFITTIEPLVLGTDVRLMLYIPGEDPVEVQGTVQWIKEGEDNGTTRSGMGIAFKEMHPVIQERLRKISD